MAKKPVKCFVVDAFTEAPFKGNPAAVCLLEEERDEEWFIAVAREFNAPVTCYLTRIQDFDNNDTEEEAEEEEEENSNNKSNPIFRIRWFTTVAEVEICGHATMAAAHVLFSSGSVNSNMIKFLTLSGILTAKRIPLGEHGNELYRSKFSNGTTKEENFSIELDLPATSVVECDPLEIPSLPRTLNGATMINIKKTASCGDLLVELSSGQTLADLKPQFDEIRKCAGRGVLITATAPRGSGYDFYSRLFCPKLGVNEDAVCGSAHCALAPYWSKKLGKSDFLAYMASPRGGMLDVHLDEENQRVQIRGKAVIVMEGSLFA